MKKEKTEAITGKRNQHNAVFNFPWNGFKRESRLLKDNTYGTLYFVQPPQGKDYLNNPLNSPCK
ncbi:MAG: hypothetical protein ACN6N7_09335 [Chryseobacterium culicis]